MSMLQDSRADAKFMSSYSHGLDILSQTTMGVSDLLGLAFRVWERGKGC